MSPVNVGIRVVVDSLHECNRHQVVDYGAAANPKLVVSGQRIGVDVELEFTGGADIPRAKANMDDRVSDATLAFPAGTMAVPRATLDSAALFSVALISIPILMHNLL